jgi:hypothetical protein
MPPKHTKESDKKKVDKKDEAPEDGKEKKDEAPKDDLFDPS